MRWWVILFVLLTTCRTQPWAEVGRTSIYIHDVEPWPETQMCLERVHTHVPSTLPRELHIYPDAPLPGMQPTAIGGWQKGAIIIRKRGQHPWNSALAHELAHSAYPMVHSDEHEAFTRRIQAIMKGRGQ